MKIAIAATTSEADAHVAMRGARAPYYLFLDTESGLSEMLPNPVSQAERGAGKQAAAFLISRGVDKVVAGNIGPNFSAELKNNNITCTEKTGTVSEVVDELSNQV